MSMEITGNYNEYAMGSAAGSTVGSAGSAAGSAGETKKSAKDYSAYLSEKYDCVKEGKVAVSSAYLRKCANDPKEAETLEENLALFNEIYDNGLRGSQREAAAHGGTVTSYFMTWSIDGNGMISMMSNVTVVSESLNEKKGSGQADWMEKLQETKKQERLAEKKRSEKRRAKRREEERLAKMRAEKRVEREPESGAAQTREITVVGKSARELREKMAEAILYPGSAAVSETAGLDIRI